MDALFIQKMILAKDDLSREIEQTNSRIEDIKRIVERRKSRHQPLSYENDQNTEMIESDLP